MMRLALFAKNKTGDKQERLYLAMKESLLRRTEFCTCQYIIACFLSNSGNEAGEMFPELGELT